MPSVASLSSFFVSSISITSQYTIRYAVIHLDSLSSLWSLRLLLRDCFYGNQTPHSFAISGLEPQRQKLHLDASDLRYRSFPIRACSQSYATLALAHQRARLR